jgi:hypothetical protein
MPRQRPRAIRAAFWSRPQRLHTILSLLSAGVELCSLAGELPSVGHNNGLNAASKALGTVRVWLQGGVIAYAACKLGGRLTSSQRLI